MDHQDPAGQPGEGEALLDGFPVTVQIPVHWGELDAFGHVNNTVYFRYVETARERRVSIEILVPASWPESPRIGYAPPGEPNEAMGQ